MAKRKKRSSLKNKKKEAEVLFLGGLFDKVKDIPDFSPDTLEKIQVGGAAVSGVLDSTNIGANNTPGSSVTAGLSGAIKGASTGAKLGPAGAIVGGGLGLLTGIFGNARRKREFEEAYNKKMNEVDSAYVDKFRKDSLITGDTEKDVDAQMFRGGGHILKGKPSNRFSLSGTSIGRVRVGTEFPNVTIRPTKFLKGGGKLIDYGDGRFEVEGPSHEEGGVLLPEYNAEVEGDETIAGDFVFSEHLGFAEKHKKIIKGIENSKKDNSRLAKNTINALERKENLLKLKQEELKLDMGLPNEIESTKERLEEEQKSKPIMKNGGKLKKFEGGGLLESNSVELQGFFVNDNITNEIDPDSPLSNREDMLAKEEEAARRNLESISKTISDKSLDRDSRRVDLMNRIQKRNEELSNPSLEDSMEPSTYKPIYVDNPTITDEDIQYAIENSNQDVSEETTPDIVTPISSIANNATKEILEEFKHNPEEIANISIEIASQYVGQKEAGDESSGSYGSANLGFQNPDFQDFMVNAGFQSGQPWCSYFVKGITMQAASAKESKEITNMISPSVNATFNNFKNSKNPKAYLTQDPQVGDLIFWVDKKGRGHTGLVAELGEDGSMLTIEGNTSIPGERGGGYAVSYKKRKRGKIGGMELKGFGRIEYEDLAKDNPKIASQEELLNKYTDNYFSMNKITGQNKDKNNG